MKYIISLLDELNMPWEVSTIDDDYFSPEYNGQIYFHNLIVKGGSNKYFTAHYDVRNIESQNANDNSASIICLIALKALNPEINLGFLDSEEVPYMGDGGSKWYRQLLRSHLNDYKGKTNREVDYILNLELVGLGGKNIVISDYHNDLSETIKKNFNPLVKRLPPNDAWSFKGRFDSVCMSTYPIISGEPNFEHFRKAHTLEDNLKSIRLDDMHEFVSEILLPLTRVEMVRAVYS